MTAPAPNTQLARLVAYFRAAAASGCPLPSLDQITTDVGCLQKSNFYKLMKRARELGLIEVRYAPNGIESVAAPDGSWVARRGDRRAGRPAPRRCLSCREPFSPPHRHRFLCDPCRRENGCEVE